MGLSPLSNPYILKDHHSLLDVVDDAPQNLRYIEVKSCSGLVGVITKWHLLGCVQTVEYDAFGTSSLSRWQA
jgi:hypothetical protein